MFASLWNKFFTCKRVRYASLSKKTSLSKLWLCFVLIPMPAPESVYNTEACAASERVYTTVAFAAPERVNTTEACACSWRCLHHRGSSCIWTFLHHRGLCCSRRCLHTEAWATSGRVYTTEACAAPGGISITGTWAASRHVYTTEAYAATGGVYTTGPWAASGRFYTTKAGAASRGTYTSKSRIDFDIPTFPTVILIFFLHCKKVIGKRTSQLKNPILETKKTSIVYIIFFYACYYLDSKTVLRLRCLKIPWNLMENGGACLWWKLTTICRNILLLR